MALVKRSLEIGEMEESEALDEMLASLLGFALSSGTDPREAVKALEEAFHESWEEDEWGETWRQLKSHHEMGMLH